MKDNEKRYQFLRDRFALESSNDEADFAALAHLNGDEFDAALDAAMLKAGFEIAQEVEPVACLIPVLSQAADCKVNGKFYQFHYGAHHKAEILFFAAPQAVNAWQPIETAPQNELVLVGETKRMGMCIAKNDARDGWVTETPGEWFSIYAPSHWMPLPGAPA